MKLKLFFLICFITNILYAQSCFVSAGGSTKTDKGSVSFSIRDISRDTSSGTGGTLSNTALQPYEISIVKTLKETYTFKTNCVIFPNPTVDYIQLNVSNYKDTEYRLYDIRGLSLLSNNIFDNNTIIDISSLSTGIYLLKISRNETEVQIFKIIKK